MNGFQSCAGQASYQAWRSGQDRYSRRNDYFGRRCPRFRQACETNCRLRKSRQNHPRRDETRARKPTRDRWQAGTICNQSGAEEHAGPSFRGHAVGHWLCRRIETSTGTTRKERTGWSKSRMKVEAATSLSKIAAREELYQLATYKKMPLAAERGEGVWLYSSDGQKYLDLYGGHAVAGVGHCHPRVVAAIREQSERLLFYSNLVYSETRARASEKLLSIAPVPLTKTFFC